MSSRIPGLTEMNDPIDPANDYIPVYDASADETKRLRTGGGIAGGLVYAVEASESDQGVTASGNGYTVYDVAQLVGTAKYATILFTHSGAANTTTYTFDTSLDLSSYPYLYFQFEPGAILARTTGDEVFTVYSSNNLAISDRQKITSVDMIDFSIGGTVHPEWWGAKPDNSTDCFNAFQYAFNSIPYGVIKFNGGIYRISDEVNISSKNNIKFIGDGVDSTIIRSTSATKSWFISTAGANRWREFRDFTLDCSTTKTAGAAFYFTAAEYRPKFVDLKIQNIYDGILIQKLEIGWFKRLQITNFDAAGAAMRFGINGSYGEAVGIWISDCFLRGTDGTDGVTGSTANIGSVGILAYDSDAITAENNDIGGFLHYDVYLSAGVMSRNHYFDNNWFDTAGEACVYISGVGTFHQYKFTGNWFSGAGKTYTPNNNARGLYITGPLSGAVFTGNRFYDCKGSGIYIDAASFSGIISGGVVENCGSGAQAGNNHGIYVKTVVNNPAPHIKSLRIDASNGNDIYMHSDCRTYVIEDVTCSGSVDLQSSIPYRIDGLYATNTNAVASAATISIPPNRILINVTGTTNIGVINGGWQDREVVLVFSAVLTLVETGNLQLAGNFTTSANDTLTLIYDGTTWYEKARSVN